MLHLSTRIQHPLYLLLHLLNLSFYHLLSLIWLNCIVLGGLVQLVRLRWLHHYLVILLVHLLFLPPLLLLLLHPLVDLIHLDHLADDLIVSLFVCCWGVVLTLRFVCHELNDFIPNIVTIFCDVLKKLLFLRRQLLAASHLRFSCKYLGKCRWFYFFHLPCTVFRANEFTHAP